MIIREKVKIGDQVVTVETGRIAKQAQGSVLVTAGETIVLVTACGSQEARPGQSFLPLSVDYVEKMYAGGKIPGGFFKREARLRDSEVLTSRLIDRPCRPLFPEGYRNEIQIIATVMSHDMENASDTLAMLGASAALHISPIPWAGPISGVRVGRVDGEWVANPTHSQMEESDVELLISASKDAIVMVEGEADELSEDELLEALFFGHAAVQDSLALIERMREAVGKPKWSFEPPQPPEGLRERVREVAYDKVVECCNIPEKHPRYAAFKVAKKEVVAQLAPEFPEAEDFIKDAFEKLRYDTMRTQVLKDGRRVDGRDTRTVRPISIELGLLPRSHGSALFTRGETQGIVALTLGTTRDEQKIDSLTEDYWKRFLLHYNFPPFSVGETKMLRGPGRREIGHGNLAERALAKMVPSKEDFPYTLRLVSEITESNGSSSMATVCGGTLAMMSAGVPIKAPVAGVAMGLIKERDDWAVLTDILGDEDALGDMDFKVCGTDRGVTAIQMDIKVDGLSREILERALEQAREARLHILKKMREAIPEVASEMSKYAPRIVTLRVKPDQIRTIIGPGGKMIKAIIDQTGVSIDVEDDGTVNVASPDGESIEKALDIIRGLTAEPEIGEEYEGTVKRLEPYGAFIEILPGKDGLCHISDIDWTHVNSVEDYMKLGDKVKVKVTNIDRDGRIRLSRKDTIPEPDVDTTGVNGERRAARSERGGRDRDRERGGRNREERRDQAARPERTRDEEETRARPERTRDEEETRTRGRDDREERPRRPRREDRERSRRERDEPREERAATSRERDEDGAASSRGSRSRRRDRDDERPAREQAREERSRSRSARNADADDDLRARARARRALRDEEDDTLDRDERPSRARRRGRDDEERARSRDREDERSLDRDEDRPRRSTRGRDRDEDERRTRARGADDEDGPRGRGRSRARDEDDRSRSRSRTRDEDDRNRSRSRTRDEDDRPRRRGRDEDDERPRSRSRYDDRPRRSGRDRDEDDRSTDVPTRGRSSREDRTERERPSRSRSRSRSRDRDEDIPRERH